MTLVRFMCQYVFVAAVGIAGYELDGHLWGRFFWFGLAAITAGGLSAFASMEQKARK